MKPKIAIKPKIAHKTNFILAGKNDSQSQCVSQTNNGKMTNNEQYADNQPLLSQRSQRNANQITLPSSPPNFSDCASDCCGILNNKHLDCIQRHKNNENGKSYSNGAKKDENGSSFHHNNEDDHKTALDKNFKTSSHSFDSLSSSSGGFKDYDYVAKTRVAYEIYDKVENNCNQTTNDPEAPASYQMPIGHSKVQEMKSKLFAQQQQNHSNNEPSIPINRKQVQKSSKELEKVLGMRIQRDVVRQKTEAFSNQDKLVKRLSKSFDDAQENNVASISNQIGANISKHIQQKLTEEMKQQCDLIKEKFLIEKIPVQQDYKEFLVHYFRSSLSFLFVSFHFIVQSFDIFSLSCLSQLIFNQFSFLIQLQNNRNQPAIGLKQHSKARVSHFIFLK